MYSAQLYASQGPKDSPSYWRGVIVSDHFASICQGKCRASFAWRVEALRIHIVSDMRYQLKISAIASSIGGLFSAELVRPNVGRRAMLVPSYALLVLRRSKIMVVPWWRLAETSWPLSALWYPFHGISDAKWYDEKRVDETKTAHAREKSWIVLNFKNWS